MMLVAGAGVGGRIGTLVDEARARIRACRSCTNSGLWSSYQSLIAGHRALIVGHDFHFSIPNLRNHDRRDCACPPPPAAPAQHARACPVKRAVSARDIDICLRFAR